MQAEINASTTLNRKIIPITPYSVKGKFRNIKSLILLIAYTTYFVLPWLTWKSEAGRGPAVLFDIAHARFHFLSLVIFPQDLMVLMAVMVIAALFLFISATLYGRVFCGFFCFQTIWTDAFRMIETWIQGEAQARIRLRKQGWNLEKAYKLAATHALWLLLAFATALTFTFYFADVRVLLEQIFSGSAPLAAYTAIAVLTSTTYVAAGIAREDICRVACPYGKFQSVMQDPATKTVIYDVQRGESKLGRLAPQPMLKTAAARQEAGYGDCIDCGYCVNVCPTGVDIRKGFQIDCISCGLCIDACDTIMKKVNLPGGLIRFDQMSKNSGNAAEQSGNWGNIKKAGYLSLLVLSICFFIYQVTNLDPFTATIQQQPQPLITRLANGDLKSRYIVRLTNKSPGIGNYILQVEGLPEGALKGSDHFEVPFGKTYTYYFNLVLSEEQARKTSHFTITITPENKLAEKKIFPLSYILAMQTL